MKRLILIVLSLSLILGTFALSAFAEETEETEPVKNIERAPGWCGEELTWSLEEGVLTITGSGPMDDFPEGAPWAELEEEITSVVFSGNISYVGAYAFQDMDNITSVYLGNSLQELGKRAFYSCDGLTELALPATFRCFGEESLMRCAFLKEIHCQGGMPSFRLNCLWDTWTDIFYPVENPWPLVHIEQLEQAFQGRIEFLAEDGYDPYVPTEPTEEPTEPTEETTLPTEEVTEPTEELTLPTEPVTEPVEETTVPTEETAPPTEEETLPPQTEPVTQPPQPPEPERSGSWIGLALVLMVLSVLGLGALVFGGRKKGKSRGRYSR